MASFKSFKDSALQGLKIHWDKDISKNTSFVLLTDNDSMIKNTAPGVQPEAVVDTPF